MSLAKFRYSVAAAALFTSFISTSAVATLSPEEAQEINSEYQTLEDQNREVGGATQSYIDQTNADLGREQLTGPEIQNQKDAVKLYDQTHPNKQIPVKPKVPAKTNVPANQ